MNKVLLDGGPSEELGGPNPAAAGTKTRGHTLPRRPIIDLDQPGRLRVANVMALFSLSHSALYDRIRAGTFPAADGRDGRIPYWKTSTVRSLLEQ